MALRIGFMSFLFILLLPGLVLASEREALEARILKLAANPEDLIAHTLKLAAEKTRLEKFIEGNPPWRPSSQTRAVQSALSRLDDIKDELKMSKQIIQKLTPKTIGSGQTAQAQIDTKAVRANRNLRPIVRDVKSNGDVVEPGVMTKVGRALKSRRVLSGGAFAAVGTTAAILGSEDQEESPADNAQLDDVGNEAKVWQRVHSHTPTVDAASVELNSGGAQ